MKKMLMLILLYAAVIAAAFSTEAKQGEGAVEISLDLFGLGQDAISLGFTREETVDWDTESNIDRISLVPGTDGIARLDEPFRIFALIVSDSDGTVEIESGALEAYSDGQMTRKIPEGNLRWDMYVEGYAEAEAYSFEDSEEVGNQKNVLFRHDHGKSVANIYVASVEEISTDNYIEKFEDTGARSWKQTFTLVWNTK